MSFSLLFTPQALADYRALERDKGLAKRLSAGRKVFEAYAENQSSSTYRVFWYYGPGKGEITIPAITSHP